MVPIVSESLLTAAKTYKGGEIKLLIQASMNQPELLFRTEFLMNDGCLLLRGLMVATCVNSWLLACWTCWVPLPNGENTERNRRQGAWRFPKTDAG
eukprot:1887002-Amphidinium_carterae.1